MLTLFQDDESTCQVEWGVEQWDDLTLAENSAAQGQFITTFVLLIWIDD